MHGYVVQAREQLPQRFRIDATGTALFGPWEWADLSDATLLTQLGERWSGTASIHWSSMGALFVPFTVRADPDQHPLPSTVSPHLADLTCLVTAHHAFAATSAGPARRLPSDNVCEITVDSDELARSDDLRLIAESVQNTARWFVRSGIHMYGQSDSGRITLRIPLASVFHILGLACYPDRMLRTYPVCEVIPLDSQLDAIAQGWRHEGHPISAPQNVGGLVADNPIARTLYDREQTCNALVFDRWEQCALAMIGWTLHMTDFYPHAAARALATLRRQSRRARGATDMDTLARLARLEQLRGSFVTNLIDFHNDDDLDATDPGEFALWTAGATGTMAHIIATINRALPPRSATTTRRRFLTALQQRCDFFLENNPLQVTPALRTFRNLIHEWMSRG